MKVGQDGDSESANRGALKLDTLLDDGQARRFDPEGPQAEREYGASAGEQKAPQDSSRADHGYRLAMYGNRLIRNARTWRAATSTKTPPATPGRTPVRQRRQAARPAIDAIPTTSVIAISVGKK